ncbi:MAG: TlpA family protein disulfide reductase, partial [Gammaproteobacteria bacterium]
MNKRSLIAIPLFVLLTASVIWLWVSPGGISRAPDIKLTITDGSIIDLQQLRGKPVLITFWATSCKGCIREMPHLIAL